MAPDRGSPPPAAEDVSSSASSTQEEEQQVREDQRREEHQELVNLKAASDTNFTIRGTIVGLLIGIIICFSNTYFGLQTGWVSGMNMPAALMGFAFFKSISRCLDRPFTPVENVLVQTVAGAVGTMPLGVGCVGVIPALEYLLKPAEGGPFRLETWRLMLWSVGICFFGVFVAVPLRKEVIIREKLPFPSGTATALMIGVLHGGQDEKGEQSSEDPMRIIRVRSGGHFGNEQPRQLSMPEEREGLLADQRNDWKAKIKLLVVAFSVSAVYTLTTYFIPVLRDVPFMGSHMAKTWLWTFNPSPAYVGQGIIMGPATTMHMLLGAIIGWAILSPLAKTRGWAPGQVSDWETGSKGWIVWVSLAIMLADSVVNLGWLALRPVLQNGARWRAQLIDAAHQTNWRGLFSSRGAYSRIDQPGHSSTLQHIRSSAERTSNEQEAPKHSKDLPEPDAPPEHQIRDRITYPGFLVSVVFCIIAVHIAIPSTIPLWATIVAILFSLVLSLMGVRAQGETDLNPVSGISKLTQLVFAVLTPTASPRAVSINLLAGAISESAALQAGDMMQDLKAGHLLGASPAAQFYGQLLGSFVGALAAALVYRLYTAVYAIPGGPFQVPTAFVWIFTARLVTGTGLPPAVGPWALGAGAVWVALTALRIVGMRGGEARWWQKWVPGGIAVAVGMYNTPSFTLARAVGGLVSAYWRNWRGGEQETVVVLASGLILGEGVVSIVNLVLASFHVPHL